jgi:single-stranded-DNA-specific exonuclease
VSPTVLAADGLATDLISGMQGERGLTKVWHARRAGAAGGAPLVQRVLAARGLIGPHAEAFLAPSLKHLHDPSLMPGLDRAAERLLAAARSGERIAIYGDYDVDGVSASAILFHTLRAIVPDCALTTYVPHRIEEGYGLNAASLRELHAQGHTLIVSVDCGITAMEPARALRECGGELIITDHHNPPHDGAPLPEAYALVHPRLPGSAYPFGDLCGAGVAFKLAWRIMTMACGSSKLTEPLRDTLLEMLGLCSLGVVADVVPLLDENRVICRFGLAKIKHSRIEGLRALVEASGLAGENIVAEDVGFKLGPRLNACGRLGHAKEAVELLTTATGARAREIAEHLTHTNNQRRATEREIFEHACELAQAQGMTGTDQRAIVLAAPGWHPGVVGIVCSRLVERFHRPAILLSEHEGVCHGSGRSVDGVNLHGAIAGCSRFLTKFGGHDMAAGLSLPADNLRDFQRAFIGTINALYPPERLHSTATYDTTARLAEVTPQVVEQLGGLAPFGRANPEIVLRIPDLRVATRPELMGSDAKHLTMHLTPAGAGGTMVRGIAWRWAEHIRSVPQGTMLDVLAKPIVNAWGGTRRVELNLVDVRTHGSGATAQ